ncbi:hypothetical protein F8388_016899 [Cannabis sativa]|uniref:Uncharacterized protein n=1 Tax=Cannabis sativa TaxID=3483 RepID=A0A7J6ETV2_CANSA|nr:hypothetical protein F8388_016899 [Cannabis sativa]
MGNGTIVFLVEPSVIKNHGRRRMSPTIQNPSSIMCLLGRRNSAIRLDRLPWRKIVNTKDFMSYYTNVVDWNDSAVKEAFDNAKKRFWAELNGFDCDIPMPDPDSYIDEVDWNPVIDSELMKELDCERF